MIFSKERNEDSNNEWLQRLINVECRDSTYRPKEHPLVFARAAGSKIWDANGREYIDLCAGFGALPLGHNSQALKDAAKDTMSDLPWIDHAMGDVYPSVAKIEFLEKIKKMLPSSYELGALSLSGGQAVEIAIKTAIVHTKKAGFIAFEEAYHGLDLGILPLTGRNDFKAPFESWINCTQVVRLPYNCSKNEVELAIQQLRRGNGFAGIIAEPIQGRAGINIPKVGWLEMLAELSHSNNGLLIFDEVFTGFGRIGRISTSELVDADILCFGKAIGGGFPISACFAKAEIMNSWPESSGEALHTGTFFGHPFSARVGLNTLSLIQELNLCERSIDLGLRTQAYLKQELGNCTLVREVRGQGLMIALEFYQNGLGAEIMDSLRELGVIVLPSGSRGHVLSITPALNIDEELLMSAIRTICRQIRAHG